MSVFLSSRYTIYKFTSSIAIAETIAPGGAQGFRLAGYLIHSSLALAAEAITFTLDSKDGANYDAVILSDTTVAGTSDKFMIPADERHPLKPGDEIDIAYLNTNLRDIGLKVYIEHE